MAALCCAMLQEPIQWVRVVLAVRAKPKCTWNSADMEYVTFVGRAVVGARDEWGLSLTEY